MHLNPDYGLFLLQQGSSPEVHHILYDFPLDHITVVGSGQFTTVKNRVFAGIEYAMSLDFDSEILTAILSKSPQPIVDFVRDELKRDAYSPRTIELPQTIVLAVEATLGQLQRCLYEAFVPFVIVKLLGTSAVKEIGCGNEHEV